MDVTYIRQTHNDMMVVRAARVSFDNAGVAVADAEGLGNRERRLIHYLAEHGHISPFFHPQETFRFAIENSEWLYFLEHAVLTGFGWPWITPALYTRDITLRGSLYAWLTNYQYLPVQTAGTILTTLYDLYPVSCVALNTATFVRGSYGGSHADYIDQPADPQLQVATLRLHVPIFVKRQLETHRRHFAMTDGDDFAQNEVSRRYVSTIPDIYYPKTWRVQHEQKKQGSDLTQALGDLDHVITANNYRHHVELSCIFYERFNELKIAHEQARMILPLSSYTTLWFTGSMAAWARLFTLRIAADAQPETKVAAEMCYEAIQDGKENYGAERSVAV